MNYENSKNEIEILSAEDARLGEMCRKLKKIDAPQDFDFKLKARIANAKPADFQPRFGFAFRYALPALALILVLGLLAYNGGFFSSQSNVTVAEETSAPQNPALPQNSATSNFAPSEEKVEPVEEIAVSPANQNLPKTPEKEIAAASQKNSKNDGNRQVKNDNRSDLKKSSTNSTVFSSTETPVINFKDQISIKSVLSMLGINADFEGGKWIVRSLTPNGIGEASGVQENDVIEAIEDKPLAAEVIYGKSLSVKTITVARAGGKSKIEMRSKR